MIHKLLNQNKKILFYPRDNDVPLSAVPAGLNPLAAAIFRDLHATGIVCVPCVINIYDHVESIRHQDDILNVPSITLTKAKSHAQKVIDNLLSNKGRNQRKKNNRLVLSYEIFDHSLYISWKLEEKRCN